jgi:hypothetical protein
MYIYHNIFISFVFWIIDNDILELTLNPTLHSVDIIKKIFSLHQDVGFLSSLGNYFDLLAQIILYKYIPKKIFAIGCWVVVFFGFIGSFIELYLLLSPLYKYGFEVQLKTTTYVYLFLKLMFVIYVSYISYLIYNEGKDSIDSID